MNWPKLPANYWLMFLGLAASSTALAMATAGDISFGIDLEVYREGGRSFLSGLSLYRTDFADQLPVELPFTYPPIAAALFAPLSWLSSSSAFALWTLATWLTLAWLVHDLTRTTTSRWPSRLANAFALVLGLWVGSTLAVTDTIALGQINVFIVAGALLAFRTNTHQRVLSALMLGLTVAVKLTTGLLVVSLAAKGRWRALQISIAGAAIATAIGWILSPTDSTQYWRSLTSLSSRVGDPASVLNQSINGWLLRANAPSWAYLCLAGCIVMVGLFFARALHNVDQPLAAALLTGLSMLLVSPVSWVGHGIWAVLVVIYLFVQSTRDWWLVAPATFLSLRMPTWHESLRLDQVPLIGWLTANWFVLLYLWLAIALIWNGLYSKTNEAEETSAS